MFVAEDDDRRSAIEDDGERMIITIEGRAAPRLSSSVVSALLIFTISAFICPGIGLVAVVLLPLALLAWAVVRLFAPDLLKAPVDTQALVIGPDHLRLYEGCAAEFSLSDDDDEAIIPAVILPRKKVEEIVLGVVGDGEDATPAIEIRDGLGAELIFAQSLVAGDDEDGRGLQELEWLLEVIRGELVRGDAGYRAAEDRR